MLYIYTAGVLALANFSTHFSIAAAVSGLAATTLLSADHITPIVAVWMMFLGIVGGLLPDIDSNHSTSVKILFNLLAGFSCFLLISHIYTSVTLIELLAYVAIVYIAIRYVAKEAFKKHSVHRGSCHSIAFIALIALICVHISNLLGYNSMTSWLAGGFILLGGLVHLTLDEIYSVDLANKRLKSSFGTAMKPFSMAHPMISFVQISTIVFLFYTAPPYHSTIQTLTNWHHFKLTPSWINLENIQHMARDMIRTVSVKIHL